jgi:hypothetical protein
MYRMLTDRQVESFRRFIHETPANRLPSPRDPQGAFDTALRRGLARDGDFEAGKAAAEQQNRLTESIRALHAFHHEHLPDDKHHDAEQLVNQLLECLPDGAEDADPVRQNTVEGSMTEGDPGHQAGFERADPRPAGARGTGAQDRRRRLAQDAARRVGSKAEADFLDRYPQAKHIGIL